MLLTLLGPALLGILPASAPSTTSLREELRVHSFEIVELTLPRERTQRALPRWRLPLHYRGEHFELELRAHSNRAPDFQVRVQDASGELRTVPAPEPRTYRGTVLGLPDSSVAASLLDSGLLAMVRLGDGRLFFIQPPPADHAPLPRGAHLLYHASDLDLGPDFCGQHLSPPPTTHGESDPAFEPGCFRRAELAFDADHEYYVASGSSVANVVANIDAVVNAVNDIYAHDVLIEHELTQVVVRSAEPDPYTSFDPGTILGEFRNEWNTNQQGVPRDIAHLATGKEMDGNIIGLAWLSVVCHPTYGYALTQFNLGFGGHVMVVAHEIGHNWSAPHCWDADFCGLMCGGCRLEFGPITTAGIIAYRNSRGCLETTDGYGTPLAPNVEDEELWIAAETTIDVLANDHDGNCDTVSISTFDATTAQGGSVTLSAGTGPGGRDELHYAPPPGFQGTDSFGYEVGDGTGLFTPGTVALFVYDDRPDLVAHFKLDEAPGAALFVDSSGHGLDATVLGGPLLGQAGADPGTGASVRFRGYLGDRGSLASVTPLEGLRRSAAVSVWIRPTDTSGAGRLFGNGGSWRFALRDGQLVFNLAGVEEYIYDAQIPTGVWTHVVASFDSDYDVSFYVDGDYETTVYGSAPAGVPQDTWAFGGASYSSQLYSGYLDDLQVYDYSLTDEQVRYLYDHPGVHVAHCDSPVSYCTGAPNSVGTGALMAYGGTSRLAANDLLLAAIGCPPGQFGLFYTGPDRAAVPAGDGILCVGGSLGRFSALQIDSMGIAEMPVDYADLPGGVTIQAGDVWCYSFWYRDPAFGGAGFNFADGLEVTFCP